MRSTIAISLMCALLLPLQALAEDIDLFLGTPPTDSKKPNVLIILDNSANWNTAFPNEKAALKNVFDGMDPAAFNVGLMMFGESPNLGYVKAAIRPMSGLDATSGLTYNLLYGEMIGAFCSSSGRCNETGKPGDGGNARTLARTFSEAYRYLIGGTSVDTSANSGQGKNDHREFLGNTYSTAESTAVHNLPFPALPNASTFRYRAPPETGACGKTYVIYIGNTLPSGNVTKDNTSRNSAAGNELRAAGGDPTTITDGYIVDGRPYNAHIDNYADEWARFMHDTMGVIFYAVDVDPAPYPDGNANGIGNSLMLKSLSQGVGGGKYFAVDSDNPDNIKVTLINILNEIQAENSVFSSVALPASTTGQSVFLNQVFIGLFRPDGNAYPRWPGNLKQYKLGKDSGSVKLFDARNELALNTSTGFITDCARSYWTDDPNEPGYLDEYYWAFSPSGTCPPADAENPSKSDSPDGPYVEKGAQAHMMRAASPTDRTVFTCGPNLVDCTDMDPFDTSTITGPTYETLLAADPNGPNVLANLVNWAVGVDLDDDNKLTIPGYVANTTESRAWIHGDVIHSRPIAINYGDSVNPSVVVYYGANDGMLRAINGNQSGDIDGLAPGEEFWAFMPPEFYDQIKRLKVNAETVKFPATGPAAGATGTPKAYGMDGPISVMEYDIDGDEVPERYIYAAMRRGGRALYAFNVSDPNDPPELLWKRGCDDTGCSPDVANGWADIGETWSNANVAYLNGRNNPVLIMGGGYDACEDDDAGAGGANHSCAATDTGDHIYVLDAVTGDLLAVHDTERAVPGGVTLVPITDATNGNPTPDLAFAYATDTGGNVYRISGPLDNGNATVIGSNAPDTWAVTPIAAFGCGPKADDDCSANQPNRKFLFGPDVVRDLDDSMIFRILVGSGDREKPILGYGASSSVDNYFYSFVDKPLAASSWLNVAATCNENIVCQDLLAEATVREVVSAAGRDVQIVLPDGVDIAAAPGYAIELADTEQVVTGALVVGDIANFSTHVPYDSSVDTDADVCLNKLGTATTYNVNFERAEGEGVDIYTGGLVPTPVAGMVILCEGDVCTEEPFCIGCGGENSPIGGGEAGTSSSYDQSKGKVYWNVEQ